MFVRVKTQRSKTYFSGWIIVPITCTNITTPVTKVETPFTAAPTQISKELTDCKHQPSATGCPPCALYYRTLFRIKDTAVSSWTIRGNECMVTGEWGSSFYS